MDYKDYYEVLGVPKTATQAEIKKAYRRLARELHPDRKPGDAVAEGRFKEANEAHAVLSDPEKRKRYDELGSNWQAYQQYGGEQGPFAGGPFPGQPGEWGGAFGANPGGARFTYRRVSPEDMGDFSDFFRTFFGEGGVSFGTAGGSPFEQVFEFGGQGGGQRAAGAATRSVARLPDAHAEAQVTLAEVAHGTERMVSIDGRRIQVAIPPGVADGARIKLRGAGSRGPAGSAPGATAGDLYLTVRVAPDPRFERRGSDLVTELPITLAEAIAGGEVPLSTPTGRLKLRIRPNTQHGQEIHIAGRGLPRHGKHSKTGAGGERGDLIVRVKVVLPQLDEAARAELAAVLDKHPQPDPRRGKLN